MFIEQRELSKNIQFAASHVNIAKQVWIVCTLSPTSVFPETLLVALIMINYHVCPSVNWGFLLIREWNNMVVEYLI